MSETRSMTSSRPYLIRALYEWIVDNGMTPLILVDATVAGVEVPQAFVENGRIILNISMTAVQGLELGDVFVSFSGRFSGAEREVIVPVTAVQAIYARETSAGMMFPDEEQGESVSGNDDSGTDGKDSETDDGKTGDRSHLRVIK